MRIFIPRKFKKLIILSILSLVMGSSESIFSQAVIIHSSNLDADVNVGVAITYCKKILRDTLTGISPTGKSFGILGYPYPIVVTDPDPPGLVNERIGGVFTGRAFLDLTVVPANFELLYHAESRKWPVIIRDPDIVSLAPFGGPLCANEPPFYLTGGSPAGGYYLVDGVIASSFNPSVAGPGTYYVYYLTGAGDCLASSPVQTITVLPVPDVMINPLPGVCHDTPPFSLSQGTPAGGTYSGTGISGNVFNPAIAGVGTHTISYTFTNGYCSKTAYNTITVNPLPVASFSGLDSVYCDVDPAVTLTGIPAGGTFTGNGISMSSPGVAVFDPSRTGLGIHYVTYTYTTAAGCTDSYTSQVRVGTLLTFTGIDPLYCQNSPVINFNYYPPGGTFVPITGLTDNSDGTAAFDPGASGAGTFNITYIYNDKMGCVNRLTQTLVIAPRPFVNFVGLPANTCISDPPLTLTGNQTPSGAFSGPGITDIGNGTAIFNPGSVPAGGPYNISYIFTDPVTGCSSSKTITTNVLQLPSATISGNSTICFGSSANLTVYFSGTSPYDFTYTDGSADFTITQVTGPHTFAVYPVATSTYTIKSVKGTNGCSNTGQGSALVSVVPPLIADAGQNQVLCTDSTLLSAVLPAGSSGRWSVAGGSAVFRNNNSPTTRVSNLQKGVNKLVWTITTTGCSASDTLFVINNVPSSPVAGPDMDICFDHVLMAANQPVTGVGRWSVINGSAYFEDSGRPSTNVREIGTGTNILRWTISNENCELYDDVAITNSLPTIAYAGEDRVQCGPDASLLAEVPIRGTGLWSIVSGSGVFANAGSYNTQITNLGPGLNTLRWTTDNGKCKSYDDISITNNLPEVFAGPDQVVYSPDTKLIGNNPPVGLKEWSLIAGSGIISQPSSFETGVSGLGEGANTFHWIVDNAGCVSFDDVVITYKVMPVVDFTAIPGNDCPPVTMSLINSSIGGIPYLWDFGDGTYSSETNTSHIYDSPGNYNIKLTATGPDGILVHKDSVITIKPFPVAQFEITPDTAYIPGNSVRFFNLSTESDSILWEFGDGTISTENNPAHKYLVPGIFDVSLSVWSGERCFDILKKFQAVYVERAGILTCPNAFTPNQEGPSGGRFSENDYSNDVFHCFADGIAEYHLEIYNRLGIILFKSDDVSIGWDGYFKGNLVTEGVYVYKVYGKYNNGESFTKVGNIALIR